MAGLIVFWQAAQQDYMVLTDISHFKRWEMLENSAIIPWNLVTTIGAYNVTIPRTGLRI